MARTTQRDQRLRIQTEFFRWFDSQPIERRESIIDALQVSSTLADERAARIAGRVRQDVAGVLSGAARDAVEDLGHLDDGTTDDGPVVTLREI